VVVTLKQSVSEFDAVSPLVTRISTPLALLPPHLSLPFPAAGLLLIDLVKNLSFKGTRSVSVAKMAEENQEIAFS
jgi:hypothetical protein